MTSDLRLGSRFFRFTLAALFGLSIAVPATAGVPLTGIGSPVLGTPLVTEAKAKFKGNKNVHVSKNVKVSKNIKVNKNIKINKNVYVKKNVYVSKNVYVKNWARKPYYGNVIAGVALGTILAATAVPAAPAPDLCWYWTNPSKNRGYWDYCY
jgi:hypothetical protein